MIEMPQSIEFFTADEITERFDGIDDETYDELWSDEISPPRGSKPACLLGCTEYADQPRQFWAKLTEAARENIVEAVEASGWTHEAAVAEQYAATDLYSQPCEFVIR